jgi:hypothetical protein
MSPCGSIPIRSITERLSLAPSSHTRRPEGFPCGSLSRPVAQPGRRRAYHVPSRSRCGLGRASSPVVRQLRRRSSEPPDLTTYLLVQAYQHLALGLCDDVYRRFTYVDQYHTILVPNPLVMLGVAALTSRSQLPSMKEEATLFRELRTPRFPATHVPVGYYGQYRRSCHSECMTVTATTSCRTLTFGSAAWPPAEPSCHERPNWRPGQQQPLVRPK